MIVIDTETTGINPAIHSIASIGAIDLCNPTNQFYEECKIWRGAEILKEALTINGFTAEALTDPKKKTLEEAMWELTRWMQPIEDQTFAGENPAFDRDFLKASAEKYHIRWTPGYRTIDLHTLCYAHYLKRGIKPSLKNNRTNLITDDILDYVGLPAEPKPHNALTGAKMEAEAFSRLIYGKPLLKEFEECPIPSYLLSHSL